MTHPTSVGPGFHRAQELLRRHTEDLDRSSEFELLGTGWTLLDGVFSPTYTPVTELFTSWLPYPVGGTFLEMGSGSGVTAVWAALTGCRHVTALDISPAAVQNTRINAARHGVSERVDVRQSDLFDALGDGERYDVIYWNSNFVEPPADFVNLTDLHHAFFDPGYSAHRRFLVQARRHLAPEGRLLLGFSDLGNWPELRAACDTARLVPSVLQAQAHPTVNFNFQLVEFTPALL